MSESFSNFFFRPEKKKFDEKRQTTLTKNINKILIHNVKFRRNFSPQLVRFKRFLIDWL
jgi:hypothetical protein